jgi:hypothetical protein
LVWVVWVVWVAWVAWVGWVGWVAWVAWVAQRTGEAAVVDLDVQLARLLLLGQLLGDAERVEEAEGHRVRDLLERPGQGEEARTREQQTWPSVLLGY